MTDNPGEITNQFKKAAEPALDQAKREYAEAKLPATSATRLAYATEISDALDALQDAAEKARENIEAALQNPELTPEQRQALSEAFADRLTYALEKLKRNLPEPESDTDTIDQTRKELDLIGRFATLGPRDTWKTRLSTQVAKWIAEIKHDPEAVAAGIVAGIEGARAGHDTEIQTQQAEAEAAAVTAEGVRTAQAQSGELVARPYGEDGAIELVRADQVNEQKPQ
ncbi:MAG: hypothetical protein AAB588_05075 [Patescibacteria group bacterium]